MNSNDDKTILGEYTFHTPNNESNNKSANENKDSAQKESIKNVADSKTEKNKISKGTAIGGAAAVGVAAAVGGVAAGTAYSEEIKDKYNELTGDDKTNSVADNTTESTDTVETASADIHSETPQSQDFTASAYTTSPDDVSFSEPLDNQDKEVRLEFIDEAGNVQAINLIDIDNDGIADDIQLITNDEVVAEVTGEEFGTYLTGSDYDPMPDVIDAGLIDDNIAYEPIDYENFEDETIQPIDDALLASDESLAGDYLTDPSITEDFTLDGELLSEDYTASTEDYSLDSDVVSEEFTASTEDYSLDSDLSSEDYLASNEDYSLDSNISSEDYAANSEDYLASNEDYQSELENTDFDNTDYSSDSFDIGFSDDLI